MTDARSKRLFLKSRMRERQSQNNCTVSITRIPVYPDIYVRINSTVYFSHAPLCSNCRIVFSPSSSGSRSISARFAVSYSLRRQRCQPLLAFSSTPSPYPMSGGNGGIRYGRLVPSTVGIIGSGRMIIDDTKAIGARCDGMLPPSLLLRRYLSTQTQM